MIRENRYLVFKLKDVKAALNVDDHLLLDHLFRIVSYYRIREGKDPLECVVVESDWPEYEPTWKAIEDRVDGAKP